MVRQSWQEGKLYADHLSAATENFHCMVDGWSCFCRKAGATIANDDASRGFLTKWFTAPSGRSRWSCMDRSMAEGVKFPWITADEGYGSKPAFLEGLDRAQQKFVPKRPHVLGLKRRKRRKSLNKVIAEVVAAGVAKRHGSRA